MGVHAKSGRLVAEAREPRDPDHVALFPTDGVSTNGARAITGNSERLTWDAICTRFPDEWVVLVGADWVNDSDLEFGTAQVIAHHKRRKDASPDVKAARAQNAEVGCFWTGEIRGPVPRFIP